MDRIGLALLLFIAGIVCVKCNGSKEPEANSIVESIMASSDDNRSIKNCFVTVKGSRHENVAKNLKLGVLEQVEDIDDLDAFSKEVDSLYKAKGYSAKAPKMVSKKITVSLKNHQKMEMLVSFLGDITSKNQTATLNVLRQVCGKMDRTNDVRSISKTVNQTLKQNDCKMRILIVAAHC